jgi:signal transduction protein with GAF and PtsI domain
MNAQLLALVGESEEQRVIASRGLAVTGIPVADREVSRADGGVEFRGMPTSRGIAIGPVYRLPETLDLGRLEYTPNSDPAREESDLLSALQEARRVVDDMSEDLGEQFGPEFAAVFHTHIQILEDKDQVFPSPARHDRPGFVPQY